MKRKDLKQQFSACHLGKKKNIFNFNRFSAEGTPFCMDSVGIIRMFNIVI